MFKRVIALLCFVLLCFGLIGCSEKENDESGFSFSELGYETVAVNDDVRSMVESMSREFKTMDKNDMTALTSFVNKWEEKLKKYNLSIVGEMSGSVDEKAKFLDYGFYLRFMYDETGKPVMIVSDVYGKKVVDIDGNKMMVYAVGDIINSNDMAAGMYYSKGISLVSVNKALQYSGYDNPNNGWDGDTSMKTKIGDYLENSEYHESQHQVDLACQYGDNGRLDAIRELRAMLRSVISCNNKIFAANHIISMLDPIYSGFPHQQSAIILRDEILGGELSSDLIIKNAQSAFDETSKMLESLN